MNKVLLFALLSASWHFSLHFFCSSSPFYICKMVGYSWGVLHFLRYSTIITSKTLSSRDNIFLFPHRHNESKISRWNIWSMCWRPHQHLTQHIWFWNILWNVTLQWHQKYRGPAQNVSWNQRNVPTKTDKKGKNCETLEFLPFCTFLQ